ncbi:radical SAM mobile pair system MarR family transcriptional regulator [Enterococcus florum]|uniref:Radical SAM mobile pair system MarR family transcriptional regulator n=1 Tax=Enterococcus florum TaxID=2480627 RepID=A0A4P5PAA7_9ENTE|nr:MarR family transcriptional regulator [Enterococcus florum]GCF92908.1 radical SAM mobile pair system MarR family transcriptional regulator [Enterococcus florum]
MRSVQTQGGFLMAQITQISGRIFERLLANAGVEEFNGAQGRILYVLWQKDDISIVELSQMTSLAKTTLTSMLGRMEQANLIQRVSDPDDKRKIRVSLTDTARKLNDDYNKISQEMNDVYYAGFSEEEVTAFEKELQRILANLSAKEKNL